MGPFYSIDAAESRIIFTDNNLEGTKRPLMQLSFHYFFLKHEIENICPQLCTYAWPLYAECHIFCFFNVFSTFVALYCHCCYHGRYLCEEVTFPCAPFKILYLRGCLARNCLSSGLFLKNLVISMLSIISHGTISTLSSMPTESNTLKHGNI